MNCNSIITTRKRLLIVILSIVFFFLLLFGRLCYVQLIWGKELNARASEQWYRDLPVKAQRGVIYDRNGNSIVENTTVYTVYVRPGAVKDAMVVSGALSSILDVNGQKLYDKITNSFVSEITVKKSVEKNTAKEIIELNLPGVYLTADSRRDYLYPEYLAQVLGYTNVDNEGQNGLEGYYDKFLTGINGTYNVQSDNHGADIGGESFYIPAINGANLLTTLDVNIQAMVEEALSLAMIEWKSKSANMLVMEANTGAIVAMAQTPSYSLDNLPRNDVNILNAYSKNTMIVDVYEPGSTFKIFTTAMAIESGVVNSSDRFFCPGYKIVDGQRIKCWRSKGHGSQNLSEGVMNSCNCVFMDLALRLGVNKTYDGLRNFGFGSKTGIDFYSESNGLLMPQSSVKTVDLARIGFGQAVAVTPVQLAAGVCSVVNGGIKVVPHFVKTINDPYGNELFEFASDQKRLLSEETSALMRDLLENVVSKGSGKKASVKGYRVGGKTGTAQKYENGVIAHGKYVSSFVGFAPVDNPRYVILMTVNEPSQGAYYGSIVAAPYVGRVFNGIFDYEQILPTENDEVELVTMPQLERMDYSEAVKVLKEIGLHFEVDGEGSTIVSTLPIVGEQIEKGDVVLLRT